MDNSTIRFPVKCLFCGRESLVVSTLAMIAATNTLFNLRVPPRDVGRQRDRA